jgi:amino acid adenylation domain-containing protein
MTRHDPMRGTPVRPLSFGQQRLWFLDQLEGHGSAYNVPFPLRMRGCLDRRALREALTDVVIRHEVLRTVIPVADGIPGQHVLSEAEAARLLPFDVVDVAESELPAALAKAADRPFDLAAELPVRAVLFALGPGDHVLLILLHHIATDGWSAGPLARDLGAAYTARRSGDAPQWPSLPVQYLDFAEWQNELLGTEDDADSLISIQLAYWTERLSGIPERITLPTDRPRPSVAPRRAEIVAADLPADLHARLLAATRAAGCTPFMGLQAGLTALLWRLGAGQDIVLGTPVAGRSDMLLADLIGFFVNTLVLRTDLSGRPSFAQLLARIRDNNLAAYSHQDVPFDRLVDRLVTDRSPAAHPLFQVMLVLQHDDAVEFRLPDLDVRIEPIEVNSAKLDLSVVFAERYTDGIPAGIGCQLEFATDLFDRSAIELMAGLLVRLLDKALAEPDRPLHRIELLDETQRAELPAAPGRSAVDKMLSRLSRADGADEKAAARGPRAEPAEIPVPDQPGLASRRGPRDEREKILCGLFADVLGVEPVGIDDGFFALGGHSLLATQLISRVRAILHVELGVRSLFLAPTVAGIVATLDSAGSALGRVRPPLRPARRPPELPVSFAQQRLWFLAAVEGQNRAYNIPLVLALTGAVDRSALAAALVDLVGRHEVLRTVLPATDGRPRQVVLDDDQAGPVLTVAPCDRNELDSAIAAVSGHLFDLAAGIPLRATLFVVDETESVLVLCLHHIAGDGASMALLLRDLGDAYAARLAGGSPDWAPLPVQYADYTLWQRDLLGAQNDPDSLLRSQLRYWTDALAGLPDELTLPVDRPRPSSPSSGSDVVSARLDADAHARLRTLGRNNQVTLFMVVHAAVAALLTRLGAGTDIAIGSPISGRVDEALDEVIGFFVNTLVVRVSTAGNPSFRALLGRVRDTALAAYGHQDLPFERLVEELNPARSLARHPLFQVMLVFQNGIVSDDPGWELPGLSVRIQDTAAAVAKFDLNIVVEELSEGDGGPAGLVCSLEFATDLFDRTTAQRVADQLVRLLAQVAVEPDRPLGRLALLTEPERERLLAAGTTPGAELDRCVHDLFAEQAAASPDATALIFAGERISYAELNDRANRLAHHLIALGVPRGALVGVYLDRSPDMAVGLLAAMKAGAGYTMLDTAFPADRLTGALDQTSAGYVLTTSELATRLASANVRFVHLDRDAVIIASWPATNPGRPVGPEDLACVMFTSGSTGVPKAIAAPHRAITGTLLGQNYAEFDAQQVWLQCAPVSWDAFGTQLFGPLVSGGTCVLQPGQQPEPELIAALAAEHGVTTLEASASLFNYLLDEHPSTFASVRRAMTGGEPASVPHVSAALRQFPQLRLTNGYGPAETMGFSTAHQIQAADCTAGAVPIGRPVAGKRAHVLDDLLNLTPPGVPGELYLAGAGVAHGYLSQAGLTAEKFLPDPFSGLGDRMYRTGDLARLRPDGVLEYLGRVDDQMKIRGFRVEPAEIQATLLRHPLVTQAAVVGREDRPGDKRLVAYIVGDADPAGLRDFALRRLPDYLVPAAFVPLAELPRTPNGKLDKRSLPAPDYAALVIQRRPRDAREEILCGLFADILGVESVGIDDGFFTRGGHSLLATRLISRIRTVFGAEIGIRDLFDAPTAATLAARLAGAGSARPALVASARPGLVPLSYAQQRLWFMDRLDQHAGSYHAPCALRLHGPLDRDALANALADVVGRHEVLRTVFPETDGQLRQRVLADWRPRLVVAECGAAGLAAALAQANRRVFDLAVEPPMRAWLFVTGPEDHVLLLMLHHIASDGWSLGPLVRDLAEAYAARCAGHAPEWAPLPVQYADYSLWQRDLLGDPADPDSLLSEQLSYWRDALAGIPEELTLPTDRPRPAIASYQGDAVPLDVDANVHRRLAELARTHQVTLFMVLQAALAALLTRLGAGPDVPIGSPVAGRMDEALDHLVGFFVNTLVLRTDTSGQPSFTELLARVRETDLAAYEHQELPFERLVEELNPARSMARHPLFQVMLVLQNNQGADLALPGLDVRPEPVEAGVAKFDLSVVFAEFTGAGGEPAGLHGSVEFATELFDRSTARAIADRLARLLEAVAARPDVPVQGIELLDEAERRRLLVDWNATSAPEIAASLPELLAAQAARTPEATAVVFADTTLSYAELDTGANRLAHHLIAHGAGPGRFVALALPRSPDLVLAVLAVLKAGAAYVPLDPDYPAERIAYMLADAAPALVLTTLEVARTVLGNGPQPGRLCLDDPLVQEQLARCPGTAPALHVSSQQPAYAIYTSGSTGRPKGVVIPHGALLNLLTAMADLHPLTARDRLLAVSTISFDIAGVELYLPLLAGATVVMAAKEVIRDPAALAELLTGSRATIMQATPSLWQTLAADQPEAIRGLRMLVGGEALPVRLAEAMRQLGEEAMNLYGPTETTVYSTALDLGSHPGAPTIGTPIRNTRLYILDERLGLVPPGAVGELYIAGAGLAHGYHRQTGLTGQRFLPDPFGPLGSRMYRTGDLARWSAEGTVEYLGRADHQVKIRGFRVELGEIEAVLESHAEVANAAVLVREDKPGHPRLVGYVVPVARAAPDPAQVRRFIGRTLPEHMVPAVIVTLDEFPVTPNGKLDRKALPMPDSAGPLDAYRAPRNPMEDVLCGLFAELLGVDRVGVDDDFFDLGGHSLLATRLASMIRAELGVDLSIRELFGSPSVAELAERLSTGVATGTDRDALAVLLPLRRGGDLCPLFCVHPSVGLGWVYSGLLSHLSPGRPVYGIQARGLTDRHGRPPTPDEMVNDYLEQIARVQPNGPYHLLGWSFGAQVAHAMAVQLQDQGQQVGLLALLDGYPASSLAGLPSPSGERELLAALLVSLGHDLTDLPDDQPLDRAEFIARVRSAGGPLARLSADQLAALPTVFATNTGLAHRIRPGIYRGDALFFLATDGRTKDSPRPEAWYPHVLGRLAVHEIGCAHGAMANPEPLARIGRILADSLTELE